MGLQFENLIVNNAMEVASLMGIGNTTIESAAPYRNVRKDRSGGSRGCQIDLLIQTPKTAYVVEVKRRRDLGREIIDEVDAKVRAVKWPAGTAVRTALVCEGRLSPGVEADGYFDAVVPFGRLLGI